MGFGIARRAHSRKPKGGLRSLLGGKAPDAKELGERLMKLSRRVFKGGVIDASPKRITFGMHPYAPAARIVVLPDGDLEIHAETSGLGPGYHAEVLSRLSTMLEELEFSWDGEPEHPETAMSDWLVAELQRGATRIGMPADRAFKLDAAVLTPLGPRDARWRDQVIAGELSGADAFAWWDKGPGRDALSRGLLAMSFDVPWREPLDNDERALMEKVDEDLTAARRADKSLKMPWAEWNELLEWLGADDEHAASVRKKVGDEPVPETRLGYRRHMLEIELSGGWTMDLGGAYVGRWEDDGGRWWATDGDRAVEFTSLTAPEETDSQKLLEVAAELNPVIERLVDGHRRGRAEVYDEGDVHVVHGLVTSAPHVAILTLKGRKSDEAWALSTWRSLRNG